MADACVLYKETCTQLHDSLCILVKEECDNRKELIEDCMHYFAYLKKYNCKAQQQCKRVRDTTHQLKKKLDSTDLILKNLQFEEIYLQREIKKCLQYKSLDEEVALMSEADFLTSLGDKPVPSEPHELMLQRLNWELEQRKAMQVELEKWEKRKVDLVTEISDLQKYLTSLLPQLEELLNSTVQVQEFLGMKLVQRKTQVEMAAWLPPQLYNIYSQVTGYSDFAKIGTTVTINGDLERAKNLTSEENSDEDEVVEIDVKHSKRRSAAHDLGKKKLFKAHPLTVEVIVPCDDGVHAKVLFTYLLKCRVVTVGISLMITTASPWRDKFSVGTDYMSSKELLCALWSKDYGDECPNPEMPALLDKYSLPAKSKIPNSLGRPFHWAQRLAGITSWAPESALDVATCRATVPPFLEAIKQRCLARLALKYQLRNLSTNTTVKEGAIPQPTLLTELCSWREISYDKFTEAYPKELARHVSDKDTVYEITVKRGKTSCKSLVVLSLDYPVSPPFTVLEITSPSGRADAHTDNNVRAIEEELNVHVGDLYTSDVEYVLTKVICKLCMCVDVYVEGMGLEPQIKFFISKFKGPDNILPYVFNSEKQYFQHRQ